jgi:hypothetical protein
MATEYYMKLQTVGSVPYSNIPSARSQPHRSLLEEEKRETLSYIFVQVLLTFHLHVPH